MNDDDKKYPISIDIGAKASVELKAEVPKESVGRVVDALLDVIRPFTERRGLRADQIRLQRTEIALEITKIARQVAELEKIDLVPPPTKFMVPFLEQASLEDEDTELHSRWAALLLSASTHYEARYLTFIDIMTRLSSQELSLIEEVCISDRAFPQTYRPNGHPRDNKQTAERASFTFNVRAVPNGQPFDDLFAKMLSENRLVYGRFMYAFLAAHKETTPVFYTEFGDSTKDKFRSLEILEKEKLVEFGTISQNGAAAEVGWFSVTHLGVAFVRNCSPLGREAAQKHLDRAAKANR